MDIIWFVSNFPVLPYVVEAVYNTAYYYTISYAGLILGLCPVNEEMALPCINISYWLGAILESAMI